MALKLSVLDQSPISEGTTAAQSFARTVELAQLTEKLGYHRYWLAEHHATTGLAGSAPEVLIAHVAAHTSTIRVGSGGIMLPHYSPLKVVEQFRVLHALHPGRIDLGLGRAPGSDGLTAIALQRDRSQRQSDDFAQQMAELLAWLGEGFPEDHPFGRIDATPLMPGGPEVWLLSSSGWSAVAAAQLGLSLCFASFINPDAADESIALYRRHFEPSAGLPQPRATVALSVICADTDTEAERLASSVRLWRRRQRAGQRGPVPTVEEAAAQLGAPDKPGRMLVGGPERVAAGLLALAETYAMDEIMAVTITHDHAARLRSYELLAGALGLEARLPGVDAGTLLAGAGSGSRGGAQGLGDPAP